ncbi:hypothetical protein AAAA58_24550 [Escherichia coli]|uniref:3'-5' exonuclease n=1 Tax=Escherichia coli TaxID=562 RepID=UPI0034D5C560
MDYTDILRAWEFIDDYEDTLKEYESVNDAYSYTEYCKEDFRTSSILNDLDLTEEDKNDILESVFEKLDELCSERVEEIKEEISRRDHISFMYQLHTKNGFYVLNIETTDLNGEVISFALIDEKQNILINEYCKPTYQKISKTAQSIHNISNEMIKGSRSIIPIYEDFLNIVNSKENINKPIFIYNEEFDLSTLYRSLNFANYKFGIDPYGQKDFDGIEYRSKSVIETFAEYFGEKSEGAFKKQTLEFAAEYFYIDTENLDLHNPATDCFLTLKLIEEMKDYGK